MYSLTYRTTSGTSMTIDTVSPQQAESFIRRMTNASVWSVRSPSGTLMAHGHGRERLGYRHGSSYRFTLPDFWPGNAMLRAIARAVPR